MSAITQYYQTKSKMDEKAAWIGKAFAGLRSRQMNFGGGEMLTVIELLKEELKESENETLAEIVTWMSHFESQQRGMYSRIDRFTTLLESDVQLESAGPNELASMLNKTVADLPEESRAEINRIRVSEWKAFRVNLNQNMVEAVLSELLLNALKFSPTETAIDIHCYISGERLIIEVVNSCLRSSRVFEALKSRKNSGLGEPFMGGYDFPRFQLPGHDLCIGLSFASALVHKMQGDLRFMDVQDYSHEIPLKRYAAVLTFPLVDSTNGAFQLQRIATITSSPKT